MRSILLPIGIIVLVICFCMIALRGSNFKLNPFKRYWEVVLFTLPNDINTIDDLHNLKEDLYGKMDVSKIISQNNATFFKTMISRDNIENEDFLYLINNCASEKSVGRFYWNEYMFEHILENLNNIKTKKVQILAEEIRKRTSLKQRVYMQIRFKSDKYN